MALSLSKGSQRHDEVLPGHTQSGQTFNIESHNQAYSFGRNKEREGLKKRNLVFLAVIVGLSLSVYFSGPGCSAFGAPAQAGERSANGLDSAIPRYSDTAVAVRFLTYGSRSESPRGFPDSAGSTGWLPGSPFPSGEAPRSSLTVSDDSATTVEIPLLGKWNVKGYSLFVLAVLLGLIDGFNPCAMWALVYLISLVVSLNDKWKIWLIVGTFVFSSGVWYFLFMSAWLNAFLFLGYIRPLTLAIGVVALFVGIKGFVDLIKNRGVPACTVVDDHSREKTINRMKRILLSPVSITSVVSIIGLSFLINSIEFVCSCAIPAVFTHVLSISHLTWLEHYGYILLYIFVFMLDDLIIFASAVFAFNALIGNRYVVYSKIVGGILLIVLGYLLIFKPHVLLMSAS
jgi:hypothetical protein